MTLTRAYFYDSLTCGVGVDCIDATALVLTVFELFFEFLLQQSSMLST